MTTEPLPPVRRSITVSWDRDEAYRRFTDGFAQWWPVHMFSIGGSRIARVVFECRPGGLIYEEHRDGTRFQWGTVTGVEPPHRVAFRWHPTKEPAQAQDVEVRFTSLATGTRVELVSTGWERLGAEAGKARGGYDMGWRALLDIYAGRRSPLVVFFRLVAVVVGAVGRLTGRVGRVMRESGGRMPPAGA